MASKLPSTFHSCLCFHFEGLLVASSSLLHGTPIASLLPGFNLLRKNRTVWSYAVQQGQFFPQVTLVIFIYWWSNFNLLDFVVLVKRVTIRANSIAIVLFNLKWVICLEINIEQQGSSLRVEASFRSIVFDVILCMISSILSFFFFFFFLIKYSIWKKINK